MLLGSNHYCAEHVQRHVRSDLNPPVDLGQAPQQLSALEAVSVLLSLLLLPCLLLSVVIVIVIILGLLLLLFLTLSLSPLAGALPERLWRRCRGTGLAGAAGAASALAAVGCRETRWG